MDVAVCWRFTLNFSDLNVFDLALLVFFAFFDDFSHEVWNTKGAQTCKQSSSPPHIFLILKQIFLHQLRGVSKFLRADCYLHYLMCFIYTLMLESLIYQIVCQRAIMAKKPNRVGSLLMIAVIPLASVIFLIGWILFYFGLNARALHDEHKVKLAGVWYFDVSIH